MHDLQRCAEKFGDAAAAAPAPAKTVEKRPHYECRNGNLLLRIGTMVYLTDGKGEHCKEVPTQDLVTFLDAEEARLAKDTFSGVPWPWVMAAGALGVAVGSFIG